MRAEIWDDIVIGAGSSGAVIASRLSEDSRRRVLLIEAGPDYSGSDVTPFSLLSALKPARDHDWGFDAEMTPGRRFEYARGRVVGGSSAVNACLALRGLPSDYDEWRKFGLEEWSWSDVLPVFRSLEDDVEISNEYHGQGGPIGVRRHDLSNLTPGQAAFYAACIDLGFPETSDHNHPEASGVGTGPWNIDSQGRRISTAMAYLESARGRKNLRILGDLLVDRVVIEDGRAVAVDVIGPMGRERIDGRRITLSGGTIGTPSVLLRSGIGDPVELKRNGIAPIVNRRGVGRNLIDHARIGVGWMGMPNFVGNDSPYLEVLLRYTSTGSDRLNDMQMMLFQMLPEPSLSIRTQLMKPLSQGQLCLNSADPLVQPDIRLNLLTDPEDMRRIIDGLQLIARFVANPRIAQIGARSLVLDDGSHMDASVFSRQIQDIDWAAEYAQRAVRHYVHPVGTSRMGSPDDPDAVVDQHGKLIGVQGLRVADASIMPTIPAANTNLSCIMIGERIAQWMLNEAD